MTKKKGAGVRGMKKSASTRKGAASSSTSKRGKGLQEWQERAFSKVRQIMREADPEIVEEWKWKKPSNPSGIPVWSRNGLICTGETYKDHIKMTFPKGASLKDPDGLFNASLDADVWRAIDVHEGDEINEQALKTLIQAAVELNLQSKGK